MGFLSRLFGGSRSGGADQGDAGGFHFYVRCARCGEAMHIRVNRSTDIADDYDGETTAKMLHKEILGSNCQNLMYVHLTLDASYRIVESQTERCTLIGEQEYQAAQEEPAPNQG